MATVGQMVQYTLSDEDVTQINRRRTTGPSIAERIKHSPGGLAPVAWPLGAQAHIGNPAKVGDVLPMLVVKVWSETTVNGQVFLDGNDVLWKTSAVQGGVGMPGMWT